MPDLTPKLGLKKPLGNETVSRAAYNENLDLIDQNAAKTGHRHTGAPYDEPPIGLDGIDAAAKTTPGGTEPNRLAVTDAAGRVGDASKLGGYPATDYARKTTADVTYYVSPSGNDANDGLTPATAFRTIQRAIDILPKVIDHVVTIQLADGTYNETVTISGFTGKGRIIVNGNSVTPTNVKVYKCVLDINTCLIELFNFELIATSDPVDQSALVMRANSWVHIKRVTIQNPSSDRGIIVSFGFARIENCTISNRGVAIAGFNGAIIHSYNNSGSGNSIALRAIEGAVITKNGTQPTGTTNEFVASGGVIR